LKSEIKTNYFLFSIFSSLGPIMSRGEQVAAVHDSPKNVSAKTGRLECLGHKHKSEIKIELWNVSEI